MQDHPLGDMEFSFRDLKCFGDGGSGKFHFAPITVLVGRNNSGKSTIIDLVQSISRSSTGSLFSEPLLRTGRFPSVCFWVHFAEHMIDGQFSLFQSGGDIPGNHLEYGRRFLGVPFAFSVDNGRNVTLEGKLCNQEGHPANAQEKFKNSFINHRLNYMSNLRVHRILAERDVQPEHASTTLQLQSNGSGLTNIVRAFLHDSRFDSNKVEVNLLADLNLIFQGDCAFERILCREDSGSQKWEIYLREASKGDVRLSQSGSALKTVFLILAFFHLVPVADQAQSFENAIVAIEEPENNLHPALLRRLLEYLATRREQFSSTMIIATHSSVCIDWASRRADSTIIHIKSTDSGSICYNTLDHHDRRSILDDLDIRGSDILQSNGIIWVEGPSDRIYLRRWIELASNEELKEGIHYSFLYYGGRILNHFDGSNPQELTDRVSMLTVNRNVAVVMDSDRRPNQTPTRKPRVNLSNTKVRIIEEVKKVQGFCWVTDGKEVENYVPDEVWETVSAEKPPKGTKPVTVTFAESTPYEAIPERLELSGFHGHKVELAHAAVSHLNEAHLRRLDLADRVDELCRHIRRWNSLV